jgi:hypothetical protein
MGTVCSVPALDLLLVCALVAVDRVVCPHFYFALFTTHYTRLDTTANFSHQWCEFSFFTAES